LSHCAAVGDMVTLRTGRPRGRPRKNWRTDPERFALPFIDALVAVGVSETGAFEIAAAQLVGEPVEVRLVGPRRKRGRGAVPGGVLVSYEPRHRLETKAAALRRKYKKPMSAEAGRWRIAMGRAFVLALTAKDKARCAIKIRELAAAVGEHQAAQTLLASKNLCLPDFMSDVSAERV
jgi:hypothetical protein